MQTPNMIHMIHCDCFNWRPIYHPISGQDNTLIQADGGTLERLDKKGWHKKPTERGGEGREKAWVWICAKYLACLKTLFLWSPSLLEQMDFRQIRQNQTKTKENHLYPSAYSKRTWQCSVNGAQYGAGGQGWGWIKYTCSFKKKKQKLTGSVRVNKIPNVCNLRNIHPNKKIFRINHVLYQEK